MSEITIQQESWRKAVVDQVKKEVKKELDQANEGKSPSKRLVFILKSINQHKESKETKQNIRLYVLCMSALVHHARQGGLRKNEIKNLESLAYNVLLRSNVKPITSQLAYLYGELQLVVSQISRLERDHWKSAWEQQMAVYYSGASHINSDAYEALSLAIRMRRLGNFGDALDNYYIAFNDQNLSLQARSQAGLGILKCYRFIGFEQEARRFGKELSELVKELPRYLKEIEWESACLELKFHQEIKPIIQLTRKSGTHFEPIYILESILWILGLQETRYHRKIPDLTPLIRKKMISSRDHPTLLKSVQLMIAGYDSEEPLPSRVRDLGFVVTSLQEFTTIEQQLLFSLAISRFLKRNKLHPTARLCALQYSRATNYHGQVLEDPLGIGSDVVESFKLEQAS